MSAIDTIKAKVEEVRQRSPFIDHVVRMVQHYGEINGNALAAAVTYFAFLSIFPILALAFAIIGQVSKVYPNAQEDLIAAINDVLPGLVGDGEGELSLESIQNSAPGVFSVGLLVALYSGLGWLSGMRTALVAVFEEPAKDKPNFVVGKLRDVLALLCLGSVLLVSVAVSGVATKLASPILELLDLGEGSTWVVWVIGLAVGLLANAVLFFAFFRLLAAPRTPTRALWSGALLGAVGFEILKQLSTFLLASTKNAPAAQAFGIALILVVWVNYFSRVVVYAASWAHTSASARAARAEAAWDDGAVVEGPPIDLAEASRVSPVASASSGGPGGSASAGPFAAGAAAMLALVAVVRRFSRR